MFKVAVGQGEDLDAHSAVETALAHCQFQLRELRPQAGIVFSSIDFDHKLVLAKVLRRFPDIELVGCTTGGDYYDYIRFPKLGEHRLDVVVGDVTGHGIEDLDRFRESPEPEDDITLVVIKVKERPSGYRNGD
jgi:serine phosphatase RsbU (regulator of sigma subunit)